MHLAHIHLLNLKTVAASSSLSEARRSPQEQHASTLETSIEGSKVDAPGDLGKRMVTHQLGSGAQLVGMVSLHHG